MANAAGQPTLHVLASRANQEGGADIYTSGLVTRLAERGWSMTLYCHEAEPDVARVCRVHELSRGNWTHVPVFWRYSALLQPLSIRRQIARFNEPKPQVVLGMAHQLIWGHRRVYGNVPLVYLPHSLVAPLEVASYKWTSSTMARLGSWFWEREERRSLQRARATIRFTEASKESLRQYYGAIGQDAMKVIPLPVADPPGRTDRAPNEVPRLLAVGRLVSTKNFAFLIETLARMADMPWRLDILGEGEERAALESRVTALGLSPRVFLHGHVKPGSFYAAADLMVMPSLLESAGMVIVEAMSHGVPVLAFRPDIGRIRTASDEFISDGVDGFLAADDADFERQLRKALGNPSSLRDAGRAAATAVARKHDWSAHVDAVERVLAASATLPGRR